MRDESSTGGVKLIDDFQVYKDKCFIRMGTKMPWIDTNNQAMCAFALAAFVNKIPVHCHFIDEEVTNIGNEKP